jgi:hypothetical protein
MKTFFVWYKNMILEVRISEGVTFCLWLHKHQRPVTIRGYSLWHVVQFRNKVVELPASHFCQVIPVLCARLWYKFCSFRENVVERDVEISGYESVVVFKWVRIRASGGLLWKRYLNIGTKTEMLVVKLDNFGIYMKSGARGGAFGWGTALKAARSWAWFPMVSLT